MPTLLSPFDLGGLALPNRVVMAPMTRARSPDTVPGQSMARYYAQRASAGLIITESTQVSAQGRGQRDTPGIHTAAQIAGWRTVTDAVHRAGGRIVVQLWHAGRLSHGRLLPAGQAPVGPVAGAADGATVHGYGPDGTPAQVPVATPLALDLAGMHRVIAEFREAARNAVAAGFDGVELHAGNGFLFEQFINAGLNTREDTYGGAPIANRLRLLLETVDAVVDAIGRARVGVRITPFGHLGGLGPFDAEKATWLGLAGALCQRRIAYLHASDLGPAAFQRDLRKTFGGAFMLAGGYTPASASAAIAAGAADLVAFGRPYIANPDLVARIRHDWPLAEAGKEAFYGGGERGYTDYPPYSASRTAA
ncbi:alkene reductase [Bordetella genomosp. 1]|uniref:Alkene reductase n=1 Tax=Bordetella genomosp. 1 TaxID=1395607 RepID=A0ABX4EZC2_9BORD|nr:alkene reductase [Bordetella genomosp. 1]OZI64014.1 alkene reductase [Bordetella genomosp. 1]